MQRLATLGTALRRRTCSPTRRPGRCRSPEATWTGCPTTWSPRRRRRRPSAGAAGHVVTLSRSLIVPFLQFSPRRDLRERAFRAWVARGENGGETDNRAIVAETLALREERARLLGYPNFAAFKLETEMAKTPEAVRDAADGGLGAGAGARPRPTRRLWRRCCAPTASTARWSRGTGATTRRRGRRASTTFDEAVLKPYLGLDAVREAAFDVAGRLFGLSFTPIEAAALAPGRAGLGGARRRAAHGGLRRRLVHPAVKRSGAWCTSFRGQNRLDGEVRPIVLNVCNFAKAPEGAPSLLTFDDARTLFHEMGHALHVLLSDVTYEFVVGHRASRATSSSCRASSTSTGWRRRRCCTRTPATPRPASRCRDALIDRLIAARNFDQGFADGRVRGLGAGRPRLPRRAGAGRSDGGAGRDAGAHRDAVGDRDAACDAALPACLRGRRLLVRATIPTCGPR